jgi:hypothetical protein
VWPSTTDKACLWKQSPGISVDGGVQLGSFTCASMVGRYDREVFTWLGTEDTRDQSGYGEYVSVQDEWVIEPIAIDNTTNEKMVAGYLFEDILA